MMLIGNDLKRQRRGQRGSSLAVESLESRQLLTVNAWVADGPSQRIVNGDVTSDYESVGIVNDGCTGTLITDRHVLTAAHCVEGVGNTQGTFEVAGQVYGTTSVTSHPQYRPSAFDAGYDIAVMELDRPVTGITPSQILREAPRVGQTLTLVGFGEGGTTNGGSLGDFGTKRVGETTVDEVTDLHVSWSLDNHNESNTAPGDSGGPAFVDISGQAFVAGVTSGGDGDPHQIGDFSFDTRVDTFASWIDSLTSTGTSDPGGGNPGGGVPGGGNPGGDPGGNPGGGGDNPIDPPSSLPIEIVDGFGYVDDFLENGSDVDTFTFTLVSDSAVDIDLFSWNGDLDTYLTLASVTGDAIAANDDAFGSTDSFVSIDLAPGTYTVRVTSAGLAGGGEYGIDIYVDPISGTGGLLDEEDWPNDGTGQNPDLIPDDEPGSGDVDDDAPADHPFLPSTDIDGDGATTLLDALQLINFLVTTGPSQVAPTSPFGHLDVDGDGTVGPLDAVNVINVWASSNWAFARVSSTSPVEDDLFAEEERWY